LAYLTLFLTSFAAATLLPAYSEILLGTLVSQNYPLFWLWFWATMGNTLGQWLMGLSAGKWIALSTNAGFPSVNFNFTRHETGSIDMVSGRSCWAGCPLAAMH